MNDILTNLYLLLDDIDDHFEKYPAIETTDMLIAEKTVYEFLREYGRKLDKRQKEWDYPKKRVKSNEAG